MKRSIVFKNLLYVLFKTLILKCERKIFLKGLSLMATKKYHILNLILLKIFSFRVIVAQLGRICVFP